MGHGGGGAGMRGPRYWGKGCSFTRRVVSGLAEGRRAAVHEVERAPLFHLQDTGHGRTDAVGGPVPAAGSRVPSGGTTQAGSDAAGSDPPVTFSVTTGLGTFGAACPRLRRGGPSPGHWGPE